ncbi:MAG: succinyldiaminopimelate aminotransferase [Gammaproteobacteria bacterium]|nr:succinyldiaminopimelate aminotransferase [Gammaproteobacteria bacterium]HBF08640.1 DUF1338 domain-containing protein [Gammaproteobacteria bacterium]|tara:strand:+ start:1324 stop:2136 length:813 start_codon:yes stop_codon:yes gene_type:complete
MSKNIPAIKSIFQNLWADYVNLNPNINKIHSLIEKQGESIINDHIAFRTFGLDGIRVEDLAKFFLDLGYTYGGDYHFEAKKLKAKHLDAPDPSLPKIFISELILEQCSERLVETVQAVISQAEEGYFDKVDYLWNGRPWSPISYQVYDVLRQESEYAAWMYVFGYRANHFTVNVNQLNNFKDLASLNDMLKKNGVVLNQSGGEIKGGESVYLSQSSTMADKVNIEFVEGTYQVPSCFYEFAHRHEMPNGKIYGGFVADNADKIFESTNSK